MRSASTRLVGFV